MYLEKTTDIGFKLNFLYKKTHVPFKTKNVENNKIKDFTLSSITASCSTPQEPRTEKTTKQKMNKLDHRLQISTSWFKDWGWVLIHLEIAAAIKW